MNNLAKSAIDARQVEIAPEYDVKAGCNIVAVHEEVYPHDVENLAAMFRTADDADDVFLIRRMTPEKAREIAKKLLEVADVCDSLGTVPVRRLSHELS